MRRFLWTTTAAAGAVTLTHQSLTGALTATHGVLAAAHALLAWPLPLVQPILAGFAGLVLLVLGVQTRGWRRVSPRQGRYVLGFTVAAILGAGPMLLFCAVTMIIVMLALTVGMLLFLCLLALLAVVR